MTPLIDWWPALAGLFCVFMTLAVMWIDAIDEKDEE